MITMPFHEFWLSLEYLTLAEQIGATWLFPLFNSLHVLSITFMLGALLMLDLRLIGVAARHYAVGRFCRELIPWAVVAFAVAGLTGLGLFITRASAHMQNSAFQWKLLLMLLAGINMLFFHRRVFRHVADWEDRQTTPVAARIAGAASLLLWAGVMLAGRWMGHLI